MSTIQTPVRWVAEVSSNHNRDLKRCLKLIDKAAQIGCWGVKFQLFKLDQLFAPDFLAQREDIRKRRQWELPLEFLAPLADRAHQKGLKFSCTPFYLKAVEELKPYVDFYKIASYELLWEDLFEKCAQAKKPLVFSTGMATLAEIQRAVDIAQTHGCRDLTLLHCVSAYPVAPENCNLAAMAQMRQSLSTQDLHTKLRVGWSDHSVSETVMYRAVHKWQADMIEFHFDLDGEGEEYSIGHCWLPDRIAAVIKNVQMGLAADGNGTKAPVKCELGDRDWRRDPSDGLRPFKKIRSKQCG